MKAWKVVAGLVIGGLCLVLLWLVGGEAWARHRQKRVEQAWVEGFGTFEQLLARHPGTVTNETARQLERLVKPLGLDLQLKPPDGANREVTQSEPEQGLLSASGYLTAELEVPEAKIDPPPPEIGAFLSEHSSDFRAIEDELLGSQPPIWKFDPHSSWDRPIPDASAMIRLQRILLAKSLVSFAAADEVASRRAVEASWKLNEEYRRVPDSICKIVALAAATLQVGVLRKISLEPGEWRARLADFDYKRSRLEAELLFSFPTATRRREMEDLDWKSERSLSKRMWNRLLRPYGSLVWSRVDEGKRQDYLEIRDSNVVREIPDRRPQGVVEGLLSITLPSTHGAFRRIDEFMLDRELTDKILHARQLRRQNGGKWPAAIPGIESTRYPGARWMYSVSPENVMTLELNQKPYKDRGGFKLPLRFTSK